MTEPYIDALAALSRTATPGPWTWRHVHTDGSPGMRHEVAMPFRQVAEFSWGADAEFAVAARVAVPTLIAEVLRLTALHDAERAHRLAATEVQVAAAGDDQAARCMARAAWVSTRADLVAVGGEP